MGGGGVRGVGEGGVGIMGGGVVGVVGGGSVGDGGVGREGVEIMGGRGVGGMGDGGPFFLGPLKVHLKGQLPTLPCHTLLSNARLVAFVALERSIRESRRWGFQPVIPAPYMGDRDEDTCLQGAPTIPHVSVRVL